MTRKDYQIKDKTQSFSLEFSNRFQIALDNDRKLFIYILS